MGVAEQRNIKLPILLDNIFLLLSFFKEVEITKTEGKIEETFHDVAPILSHNTLEIVFYLV